MQSHTSRLRREPANILHMVVEAAQLLVHRGRSGKVPRDDGLGAQHDEQMPECRAQIAVVPPSRRRILTLEQMVIEKSLDGVLVNPIDVQPRPAHPKRKHCKACHVYIDGARCVPALAQMMPESISVGRQLTRKKLVRRIAKGEDREEAKKNNEAARLWISGIEIVKRKLGLVAVYDLSATPFFLRGSGYAEGTLFPWTVSDFSLMDAIECGIVKLPRVPIADNIPGGDMPKFRELWKHVGPKMPKKGRGKSGELDPLGLPNDLQTALEALYGHYAKTS